MIWEQKTQLDFNRGEINEKRLFMKQNDMEYKL